MDKLKVGDRVRVTSGAFYAGLTGFIVEDDGDEVMNFWVDFDGMPDDETPFGPHELMKIG